MLVRHPRFVAAAVDIKYFTENKDEGMRQSWNIAIWANRV